MFAASPRDRPLLLMQKSTSEGAGADLEVGVRGDPATTIRGDSGSNISHDLRVMHSTAVHSSVSRSISFPSVASDFSVRTALPRWLWFSGRLGVMNAGVCSVISLKQSSKVKFDPALRMLGFWGCFVFFCLEVE